MSVKDGDKDRPTLLERFSNGIALALAAAALIISLNSNYLSQEANEIARSANEIAANESSPDIKVLGDNSSSANYIQVTGCQVTYSELKRYVLTLQVNDVTTITNVGGRTASLLDVALFSSDGRFYNTSSFMSANDMLLNTNTLQLPLVIEPGTAMILHTLASTKLPFDTKDEALFANVSTELRWRFYFSDGTVSERSATHVFVTTHPELTTELDKQCQ